ncbi:MAG: ABC transporter permease [Euryarchaeota archaeon]|nr:ABC transporter permease [Euryarchaeota archaeon]MDE1836053.1 ABC transporter permease [Euryarchaeota archaeon]MDE1879999.1 ABC transporter permease [Euryarchaeota archaeon]MDE2044031.1 ABC transporter permease [Thermoplasmata archaeon]
MTSRGALAIRYMLRQKGRTAFVIATYTAAVTVTLLLTSAVVGNEESFLSEVNNLAVNWIDVTPNAAYYRPLTVADANAIQADVPHLTAVTPILWALGEFNSWPRGSSAVTLTGSTSALTSIFNFQVAQGSVDLSAPASMNDPIPLVVGYDLWNNHSLSVGQSLPVTVINVLPGGNSRPIQVTLVVEGLLGHKGTVAGINFDLAALIPVSTLVNLTGAPTLTYIFASADSSSHVQSASDAITNLIYARHNDTQDFTVSNQQSEVQFVLQQIGQFQTIIQLVEMTLLVLSAFSIFVVMTMAVKDRRREIGVLRALGAERTDVMLQFLLEAGTMSVVGIGLGVGLGTLVVRFLKTNGSGFYSALVTNPVDLGLYFVELLLVLWFVGFLFSLLPAYQASRLEAVEALREM